MEVQINTITINNFKLIDDLNDWKLMQNTKKKKNHLKNSQENRTNKTK